MYVLVATDDDVFQMDAFRAAVHSRDDVTVDIDPIGATSSQAVFSMARKHVPGVCIVDEDFTRQGGIAVLDALVSEPFPTRPVLASDEPWKVQTDQLPEDTILIEKTEDAVADVVTGIDIVDDNPRGEHRILFNGPVNVETPAVAQLLDEGTYPRVRVAKGQVPHWVELGTVASILTEDRQVVDKIRVGDLHTVQYANPDFPDIVELHPLVDHELAKSK